MWLQNPTQFVTVLRVSSIRTRYIFSYQLNYKPIIARLRKVHLNGVGFFGQIPCPIDYSVQSPA